MIFYFSATGNSLYVAKSLDENALSIPQALRANSLNFEDETLAS